MSLMEYEMPMDMGGGMAASGGVDLDEQEILDALQARTLKERDKSKQAALAKIASDLAKLFADEEDAQITAMGGNPKQLRAMSRAGA